MRSKNRKIFFTDLTMDSFEVNNEHAFFLNLCIFCVWRTNYDEVFVISKVCSQ